jgi:MFS family permease
MSEHPLPPQHGQAITGTAPATAVPERAPLGLIAIFGSTFFQLVGYFMLMPLLLLRLKGDGVSTALAGVFVATGWLGVFCMTPFASAITQRLGRRPSLWLAAAVPVVAIAGFLFSDSLLLWFACILIEGMAAGLRWVLAEAIVAEFSPAQQRGRNVGIFETMVGTTFVLGPVLLAWVGAQSDAALWMALGLTVFGLGWSLLIPRLPAAADAHSARVGLSGVWHALRAHPLIMTVGFVGGFFESGLTSILPLYGLALGLGATAAALLVSASGLGSALMMLPAGLLADRLAHHPQRRWGDGRGARLVIMRGCALITLLATLVIPFVAATPWLAAPVAFLWGGAGGCLYTLAMIDIGSREEGITLVNSTAVLVLSYTLGGVLAPALGAAALEWAPTLGFPALLLSVAGLGWWLLRRAATSPSAGTLRG